MKKSIFLVFQLFLALNCMSASMPADTGQSHDITIMTYNVKLLPRGATFLHHHPVKRARLIPAKLISENPDVIVFEEAFDGLAVRILKKQLRAVYPYNAGMENRKLVTYKRAGGVLIFSKYALKELESIKYTHCSGADCMGNKGAILVEVEHPLQKFQLLGTHIQAGHKIDIKESQYQQVAELVDKHKQAGIPQFIAGDFNTHKDDTLLYDALINTIKATDGPVDAEAIALERHAHNDMREQVVNPKKKKGIIDYVFIRPNGIKIKSQQRYARQFQQTWSAHHKDLSDHFAVILKLRL
jgi:endonuclease/exonuclease/phosphatase family metal-dependent hydrolase